MKKALLFIITVVLILTFSACGAKNAATAPSSAGGRSNMADTAVATKGSAPAPAAAPAPQSPTANYSKESSNTELQKTEDINTALDRKIIYNASVSLDVKDLKGTYENILAKGLEMGGYVANSGIRETDSQITIRVPAVRLDDFMKYLDTLGGQNKESSINTNDVTDQYTDIASRVKNLKAQEEQLLTIMKKASTVDETLKVQSELFRVRGEIESFEGRINMWDKLIEYSTVSVRLNKIQEIGGKDVNFSFITWDEIGKGISNGFKGTLNFVIRFFSGAFIVLISALPVLPFIALILWLVLRYRKKLRRNLTK